MVKELTDIEFKETMGEGMIDITEKEIENPIDIWRDVKQLQQDNILSIEVYEKRLVEHIYRNNNNTFDHILIPSSGKANVYVVVVVDLRGVLVYGYKILDLNKKYSNE